MPSKISFYEHEKLSKQEFLKLCYQGTYENNLGPATGAIQFKLKHLAIHSGRVKLKIKQ